MKRIIILILVTVIFTFSSSIYAGEFGDNGLITIPTANTLRPGELNLIYQRIADGDLVVGDYSLKDGVQLGGGVRWPGGLAKKSDVYLRAKVNLVREDKKYIPELSFGIIDSKLYLVASKNTQFYGIRAHLGIADANLFSDRIFGGFSKVLNPITVSTTDNSFNMPVTTLMAEYNDSINVGARFSFNSGIDVNLGVLDFDDFNFGISFRNEF